MSNKRFALMLLVVVMLAAVFGAAIAQLFPDVAPIGAVPGAIVVTWGVLKSLNELRHQQNLAPRRSMKMTSAAHFTLI